MKTRLSSRDSRLFAALMRDEFYRRGVRMLSPDIGIDERILYAHFLRSQSNHADANCPYRRAVEMICARA